MMKIIQKKNPKENFWEFGFPAAMFTADFIQIKQGHIILAAARGVSED